MDDKFEQIEDSLEDLLIFPTQQGLRRSIKLIEECFDMEGQLVKEHGTRMTKHGHYKSMVDDQQELLDNAREEISGNKLRASPTGCASNWIQAPKSIDKGVDKNVVAQLASSFSLHMDDFNEILSDATK